MKTLYKSKDLTIAGTTIQPGQNQSLEIEIARLPSGTLIHMQLHVFRSKKPGPVVLLSGGLHGDEINGIEIVRRLVHQNTFDELEAGSVIAIPIINVYGFLQFSREVPDGKDVNRSFPGSADGSLAALVAHTLTKHILPVIDFGIDFHTGGASRSNYPQIRMEPNNILAQRLCTAFAPPLFFESPLIQGSLRDAAASHGKTILVYEGGESLRFHESAILEGIKGAKRVLQKYDMISGASQPTEKSVELHHNQWIRADVSGLFTCNKWHGSTVEKDEVLGVINSPYGNYDVEILSPIDGVVISHNNMPLVHKGDALFQIGRIK